MVIRAFKVTFNVARRKRCAALLLKASGRSVKRTAVLGTAFILHSQGTRAFSNEDAVYAYVKYCAASLRTQLENAGGVGRL